MGHHVLLVNHDRGHGAASTHVQGYSGKSYGVSRFSAAHSCHVCKLSVEAYNACAKDLSKAWHLSMRRWVPIFVEDAEAVTAPEAPTVDPLTEVLKEIPPPEQEAPALQKRNAPEQPTEVDASDIGSEAHLRSLPWPSLKRHASEIGYNSQGLDKEALITGLLACKR